MFMRSADWQSRGPSQIRRQLSKRGQRLSSSYSLWDDLMTTSSEFANRAARRRNVPSPELRFVFRDSSSATHETVGQTPRLDLADADSPSAATTRADRRDTASASWLFTFLM